MPIFDTVDNMLGQMTEIGDLNQIPEPPDGLDRYLKPTPLIDSESLLVRETAERITWGCDTTRDQVHRLHAYVTNDIRYGRIRLWSTASQVLRRKIGNCTNTSVALVAMCRALGIPSRMHYFRITRDGIKHLVAPVFVPFLDEVIPLNARADIYLDDHWVTLESELDSELYRGLVAKKLLEPIDLPWDGHSSTHWLDKHTRGEVGVFAGPEGVLAEFLRNLNPAIRCLEPVVDWFSNRHLDKHRLAGR